MFYQAILQAKTYDLTSSDKHKQLMSATNCRTKQSP